MKLRNCLVLLLIISVIGCSENPEKPSQLIPEDKYIDLIVDLQLVRSYTQKMSVDSSIVDSLTKEVFNKHGVTSQSFRESHTYYQEFPKQQKERIDLAMERLKLDLMQQGRGQDTTDTSGRPDHTRIY